MFYIVKNALQNSANLKLKIVKHYINFPIYLYKLIKVQIKNISKLTYKMMLFKIENKKIYTTNELFNKQKKPNKREYKLKD